MYVYSCNALSARFFDVDRALNSYFMIIIMIYLHYFDRIQSGSVTSKPQAMYVYNVINSS